MGNMTRARQARIQAPSNVRHFPTVRPEVDVSVTLPEQQYSPSAEPNYLLLWGGVIAIACIGTSFLSFNISKSWFNQKYDRLIQENSQLTQKNYQMRMAKEAFCNAP